MADEAASCDSSQLTTAGSSSRLATTSAKHMLKNLVYKPFETFLCRGKNSRGQVKRLTPLEWHKQVSKLLFLASLLLFILYKFIWKIVKPYLEFDEPWFL